MVAMNENSTSVPPTCSQPAIHNPEPTTQNPQRRCGAPAGNRNAQVHGFYSNRATEALRRAIKENTSLSGFDREVMLAFWQYIVVNTRGATQRVAERVLLRLVKLVRVKYGLGRDDLDGMENALQRLPCDLPISAELARILAAAWGLPAGALAQEEKS